MAEYYPGPGLGSGSDSSGLPPDVDAELKARAGAEVEAETTAAVAPYEADIGTYGSRQTAALGSLADMFKNILGASGEAAKREESFYQSELGMERDIFGAAAEQLNQFRQGQAAEAQTLAQRLGGPVPISEFTYGVDVAQKQAGNDFASSMLHSLGLAGANVGEAEAFAGRVLPLVQKEETSKTIRYFNDLIAEAQKQISAIKAAGEAKKLTRYDELRAQELQYRLEKLKADRDFMLAKQSARQEQQRIAQERRNAEMQRDAAMGRVKLYDYVDKKGKRHVAYAPTLEAKAQELDRERATGTVIDPITGQPRPTPEQQSVTNQNRQQREAQARADKANATSLIDAATGGGSKTITITQKVEVDPSQAGQSGVFKDPATGKYYRLQNVTSQVTGQSIGDPRDVYRFLISRGVNATLARQLVAQRFNLGANWDAKHYTVKQLEGMQHLGGGQGFVTLRRLAISLGWKPPKSRDATSDDLIKYILDHQNRKSGYTPPGKGKLPGPRKTTTTRTGGKVTVRDKTGMGITSSAPDNKPQQNYSNKPLSPQEEKALYDADAPASVRAGKPSAARAWLAKHKKKKR